jgi:N-acetylmuramoyl-L-alanine amidase
LVDDELVGTAQLASDGEGVRMSLSLKRRAQTRLLVLESPYRVVVDVAAAEATAGSGGLVRRRVVLDPGHGGVDAGASAAKGGVKEKDAVLAIAREVQRQLVARGVDVVLTRDADTFVSLEERTAIANRAAADLFVSVHANSHKKSSASGIETYYLDTTDDDYALRLAARENATQAEQVSELQLVLADLAAKVNTRASHALAAAVQTSLVHAARKHNRKARDLGVKGSLFYVLLGARMPAVLVETSFVSNPTEARLLSAARYREALARAIADGVLSQLQQPVAMVEP